MAQVVSTDKKVKLTPNPSGKSANANQNNKPKVPLFRKMNYILMIIGIIFVIIGYFCISGGAAEQADQFNPEVFSFRRVTLAPILIILGLVTEIFAIMWRPKCKGACKTEEKAE